MTFFSEIGHFILAVVRQVTVLITGGIIATIIVVYEHVTQKSLPWGSYRTVLEFVLGVALFLTWREQFRRVKELEPGLDPRIRRELQVLVDEGTQIRQAIIVDADPDPWTRLRAPDKATVKDKWMDRVEDYLYLSVDSLTSRAFKEVGVPTGVPPYPGAQAWPDRKRDAIMHLDARIDYLRRLLR
jgi:hypothetical protein